MVRITSTGRWSAAVMLAAGLTLSACNSDRISGTYPAGGGTRLDAAAPTMAGETFSSTSFSYQLFGDCTRDASLTLLFNASGIAGGPFPGTFTEDGKIELTFINGSWTVTAFSAGFTITTETGQTIKGTKDRPTGRPLGTAVCDPLRGFAFHFDFGSVYTVNDPKDLGSGPTEVSITGSAGKGQFDETFGASTGAPAKLVLTPVTSVNTVDTKHCVTANVTDITGNPVSGVSVVFSVSGSVTAGGSIKTDAQGNATFCYLGPPLPGADRIHAFADTNGSGRQDPDEPFGDATKVWVLPVTTPNCEIKITNGGWIIALNGDRSSFGGNAKSSASGDTQGQEEYQDHGPAQPMNVHSINVLAIVCDEPGIGASIYGDATIDGEGSFTYRIKVRDLGEPGKDSDTYWIILSNGYNSGDQVLQGGNVQVHKQ